ncbi:MAG: hypothetical protein IT233_06700 [Bacteroidia bacterium]|nr:hypothetical protein [Bacteroidia bacterium]
MTKKSHSDRILKLLEEKASLKQTIYHNTIEVFDHFKMAIKAMAEEYSKIMVLKDERVIVEYKDRGAHHCEMRVGGDLLIFIMHTNVFEFDRSHPIWKSSYIKKDENRSFCGMIMVYNFLSDSFKYNRSNDVGYLIGRVFINKDKHYFVDGKKQLGFMHNEFFSAPIADAEIRSIIESAVLYCLEFDLYTPPFETFREITVNEMLEASNMMQIKTGKRLGFKFQSEDLGE